MAEGTVADQPEYYVLTVNGFDLLIDKTAATLTWFDSQQMSSVSTNKIKLGDFPDHTVYINGVEVSSGDTAEVELDKLGKGIGIQVKLVEHSSGAETLYYIRTLHSAYNNVTNGEGTGDGYYYFTQSGNLYKMDTNGDIVFFSSNGAFCVNFTAHLINGEVYYSYAQQRNDSATPALEGAGATLSKHVIMNDQFEIIDEIVSLSTDMGMPEDHPFDHHEFVMIDVGHYIVTAYVAVDVDNIPEDVCEGGQASVVAAVIQELKDGELIFQWNSTDYPELYAWSSKVSDYSDPPYPYTDYLHLNGIVIDPDDGNLVCSFRQMDSVLKLDRSTGEIIWVLGGDGDQFGLTEEQLMSHQHFPRFTESGSLTIFDNGISNVQTRALEYVLDEENLTVTQFNAYQVDGAYSFARGSTQKLDEEENIFLMGWGTRPQDGAILTEIDFDTGEVLFEVYDIESSTPSYRSFKFEY